MTTRAPVLRALRRLATACVAAIALAVAASVQAAPAQAGTRPMAEPPADFSARIDALWDFNDPALSAQRFAAERARHAPQSREALELTTQIARTEGLQRHFDEAHRLLDSVAATLPRVDPRVQVRYLLERGRTFNSAGAKADALPLFRDAYERAVAAGRPGDAFYAIDALHMLAIAAPPAEQLAWNQKALAAALAASGPRARQWQGSLLHNLGWTYFEAGDYATAVAYWQRALAFRIGMHDEARTRIARWTVARGLRAQGKLDEAAAMQAALASELAAAHAPDGSVFEELMEIATTRGDAAGAQRWAAQAYPLLKADVNLAATEPQRLARVAAIAGIAP